MFGALALVPTMVSAIATHLFVIGGAPTPAVVLLAAASLVVWVRRDQLPASSRGGAPARLNR